MSQTLEQGVGAHNNNNDDIRTCFIKDVDSSKIWYAFFWRGLANHKALGSAKKSDGIKYVYYV